MRKILSWLLAICIFAVNYDVIQISAMDEGGSSGILIDIETQYKYSDMDKSYSEGYKPTVKNGKVNVVLPIAATDIFYDDLTIVADVGTSGPFIASNQRKKINYSYYDHTISRYIYIAEFEYELTDDYKSGTYAVNFSVSGFSALDIKTSANYVVYVVLDSEESGFSLEIIKDRVFGSMQNTYHNGYVPTVENNSVNIILPLEVIGEYDGTVSVTARTSDNSVFKGVNYNKIFSLQSGGYYIIDFDFPLNEGRKNGSYPVEFTVTADESVYNYTVYVVVSDEVESGYNISIVNDKIYAGMNNTYQDGYIPTVKNDTATIILPLYADNGFDGAMSVTAKTTDSSVFSGVNYNKTFYKHTDGNYLVTFELPLNPDRKNGSYPVELTATAGESTKSFTVYVVIADSDSSIYLAADKVYSGMNLSYQEGYIPTVKKDKATIVLPLAVQGNYSGDITVTSRAADSSVFSGVNYSKVFSKRKDGHYLVRFTLPLNPDRKNGNYPVEFTVTADGSVYNFTVYVVITDEVTVINGFYIDNQNVYEGMNASYSEGYKPTVSYDKATVVLPVKAQSEMQGDLTVKAEVTDNTNETFEIRTYEKNISKDKKGVYLAQFDFNLLETRKNGVYAVKITVSGSTVKNDKVEAVFTVYITVSDEEEDEETVTTPNIIIESFSADEFYTAGDVFSGTVTLKNINSESTAQNIQIRMSSQSQSIEIIGNTNMIYYENMPSNSLTFDLNFKTKSDASSGKHAVNLDITYEDENNSQRSSSGVLYINVKQVPDVELETNGLDNSITAGDTVSLTADVYNVGKGSIYNVTVKVEGIGLLPAGSGYIGTMNPESGQSVSIDVFVGSKTMSSDYEGTEKYGYTDGKIILTYEDEDGTEFMQETKISTQITAPASTESSTEVAETDSSWWVSLIAGGCIIIFTGTFLFFTKHRNKWSTT